MKGLLWWKKFIKLTKVCVEYDKMKAKTKNMLVDWTNWFLKIFYRTRNINNTRISRNVFYMGPVIHSTNQPVHVQCTAAVIYVSLCFFGLCKFWKHHVDKYVHYMKHFVCRELKYTDKNYVYCVDLLYFIYELI